MWNRPRWSQTEFQPQEQALSSQPACLSVCLSRHSEPHQAGQSQGLDPGGGNRVMTHEHGSKPSLSDALRIVPRGLFTDSHQIRDGVSPGSPGRLVGMYFKPDFFWKESLRNFCLGTSFLDGPGSISGQGTRSHRLNLKILNAATKIKGLTCHK